MWHLRAVSLVVAASFLPCPALSEPLWSNVCRDDDPMYHLPFCNSSLSIQDRVDDYVSRIPTESKIAMMSYRAAGYDPLGIPPYQWWSEGLHGALEPCVTYNNVTHCPTSFPCPSGLGNSFNTSLYRAIGTAIGKEGRAISQLRNHDLSVGDGITFWSPNVNMQRDPRWGRNQEAPGEDPLLTSLYARNFVQGLQQGKNEGDTRMQVAACCKHFVANSLESWKGHTRHNFDARISDSDLHNYYFVPFQECVQAGAAGIMCSYNAINGIPSCLSTDLQVTMLRESWNFKGYLVTDCGALQDTINKNGHNVAKDAVDASAQAVRATVDVNCGNVYHNGLLEAFHRRLVAASAIDATFERLASIQFRLGLFDTKEDDPKKAIDLVGSHKSLALEAALQSIVLLKHTEGVLPLDSNQKITLIGPHIFGTEVFASNYAGELCPRKKKDETNFECIETPVAAISKRSRQNVSTVQGCYVATSDLNEIEKAVEVAIEADRVILVVGIDTTQEQEEHDRTETVLPGLQQELVRAVLEVAAEKTIMVLVHGGSLSLGEDVIGKSSAILSASYGGVMASEAMARVLFGEYNPTGKLAATMYPPSYVEEIPLTEMGLNVGVGRTYMYYAGDAEFLFGHGLSYSDWSIDWMDAADKGPLILDTAHSVKLSVRVTNLGPMEGSQTVLFFWLPSSSVASIRQKLVGFQGTSLLAVGESQILQLEINQSTFELWDSASEKPVAATGLHMIKAQVVSNTAVTKSIRVVATESTLDSAVTETSSF